MQLITVALENWMWQFNKFNVKITCGSTAWSNFSLTSHLDTSSTFNAWWNLDRQSTASANSAIACAFGTRMRIK
jgi:hypothetical protein